MALNFDQFAVTPDGWVRQPCWRYEFPNGCGVLVTVDLRRPFRFEWKHRTQPATPFTNDATGLTSDQVETKLAAVAALPPND